MSLLQKDVLRFIKIRNDSRNCTNLKSSVGFSRKSKNFWKTINYKSWILTFCNKENLLTTTLGHNIFFYGQWIIGQNIFILTQFYHFRKFSRKQVFPERYAAEKDAFLATVAEKFVEKRFGAFFTFLVMSRKYTTFFFVNQKFTKKKVKLRKF